MEFGAAPQKIRILLVEDNPADARLAHSVLSGDSGTVFGIEFEIEVAATLHAARERAASADFDAVLLDLHLPDAAGIDTLHAAREALPNLPIIVLTGSEEQGLVCRALQSGAQDYLVKGELDSALWARSVRYAVERFRGESVRREAELALRHNQERLRLMLRQMPGFMWTTDRDLRVTSVEGKALEHMPRQSVGLTLYEYYGTNDPNYRALAHHNRALRGESVGYETEFAGRTLQCFIEPLRDADGQIAGCVGVSLDITERTMAENALRASEQRYRELFENANDVVYTMDLEGNFTSFNSAGERITGYTRDEMVGLNLKDVITPESLARSLEMRSRKLHAIAENTRYEVEVIAKDGRLIPMEVNTRLVYRNEQPVAVQGIARDISERKRLEAQLLQSQKMQSIGQLAAGVAHEFNNLLTVIMGNIEVLSETSPLSADQADLLQQIHVAADRAASITAQLLAFGRRQMVSPRRIDLNAVVQEVCQMLRPLLGARIEVRQSLAPSLLPIHADAAQLTQVIVNLAVNARDAMPSGGVLTLRTANVQLDHDLVADVRPGKYVLLEVADTGSGMDARTQSRAFEPFFTTKPMGQGTGLGLAMVYGAVKQAGGHVTLRSEPGRGSSFALYLPAARESG